MIEWAKKWNPFNSEKLLAHLPRWSEIPSGRIPPPVLVTIDPVNRCNMLCPHCNSNAVTGSGQAIDPELYAPLARFLKRWGVGAVCVAGGGEPLLAPTIVPQLLGAGLKVGIVTNGLLLRKCTRFLRGVTWLGVSVDCATHRTFERVKGVGGFEDVIAGIRAAVGMGWPAGRGSGVFYKYLILPGNEGEISDAARLAKSLGCRGFHARPADLPWNRLADKAAILDIPLIEAQCREAHYLEDEQFGVYTVTHKFGANLARHNDFPTCWGCFLTLLITPGSAGCFNVDLCCDRRGDRSMRLVENWRNPEIVRNMWGSAVHKQIQRNIAPANCPRCTYGPHSRLIEETVLTDNLTWEFI